MRKDQFPPLGGLHRGYRTKICKALFPETSIRRQIHFEDLPGRHPRMCQRFLDPKPIFGVSRDGHLSEVQQFIDPDVVASLVEDCTRQAERFRSRRFARRSQGLDRGEKFQRSARDKFRSLNVGHVEGCRRRLRCLRHTHARCLIGQSFIFVNWCGQPTTLFGNHRGNCSVLRPVGLEGDLRHLASVEIRAKGKTLYRALALALAAMLSSASALLYEALSPRWDA
jgi:hypothetical protein